VAVFGLRDLFGGLSPALRGGGPSVRVVSPWADSTINPEIGLSHRQLLLRAAGGPGVWEARRPSAAAVVLGGHDVRGDLSGRSRARVAPRVRAGCAGTTRDNVRGEWGAETPTAGVGQAGDSPARAEDGECSSLYFIIHRVARLCHMIVGMGVLGVQLLCRARELRTWRDDNGGGAGLYWHLVDVRVDLRVPALYLLRSEVCQENESGSLRDLLRGLKCRSWGARC